MSPAYYFDQHVRRAIALGLQRLGIDVPTAVKADAADWPVEWILEGATALERIDFSCDADFLERAADRLARGVPFAGVVYAHQLQITIGQAVRDLELIVRLLTADEIRNQIIYLPM